MTPDLVYIIAAHPFYTPLYVNKEEFVKSKFQEVEVSKFYNVINDIGIKCVFERESEFFEIF